MSPPAPKVPPCLLALSARSNCAPVMAFACGLRFRTLPVYVAAVSVVADVDWVACIQKAAPFRKLLVDSAICAEIHKSHSDEEDGGGEQRTLGDVPYCAPIERARALGRKGLPKTALDPIRPPPTSADRRVDHRRVAAVCVSVGARVGPAVSVQAKIA